MAEENIKDQINEKIEEVKETLKEMPLYKKVMIGTVVAISFATMILLFQLGDDSRYQVLFSKLASEDMGLVTAALDKYEVSYQIDSTSKAVLVHSDEVLATRLKLAQDGLPKKSGVGFELFDEKSFGMTDFEQQLNFQRALQGELERTINEFKEIDDSRVHLVIPEKSVFLTSKEPATASIILKVAKGEDVAEETVQAIVHMVSSSVKDLDSKAVTVVDTNGNLLTENSQNEQTGTLAGLRKKRDLEVSYENKVRTLLEPIVGFGKIKVRVTADLDYTEKQTTEEKFDPDSIAIRSETRSRDKETTPSLVANINPQQQGESKALSNKDKDRQSEAVTYEVSKQVQQIVHPTGELKNLSIAVIVDGNYVRNDEGILAYKSRSEDEMKQFEELIKSAIGYSTDRGDQLKVMNLAFQNPDEMFNNLEGGGLFDITSYSFYMSVIVNVIIAILALAIVFFVIRPIVMAYYRKDEPMKEIEDDVEELLEAAPEQKMLNPFEAKKDLEDKALSDPAYLVNALRQWMGTTE